MGEIKALTSFTLRRRLAEQISSLLSRRSADVADYFFAADYQNFKFSSKDPHLQESVEGTATKEESGE